MTSADHDHDHDHDLDLDHDDEVRPLLVDRPEAVRVTLGADADAREIAAASEGAPPSFLYVDCGAWMGDGRHVAVQRCFAVVCGEHAVLCEFQAGRASRDTGHTGPEAQAIQRLLAALAGPQRMDVAIRRWCVRKRGDTPSGPTPTPTVFLPDMHLPLVGRMPDLDPDLVPDPNQARCWCHGPIFARIDGADLLCQGPDGTLFVGSSSGSVFQVARDGTVTMPFTGLKQARGCAYDGAHRRLFVAEHDPADAGAAHTIRIFPVP